MITNHGELDKELFSTDIIDLTKEVISQLFYVSKDNVELQKTEKINKKRMYLYINVIIANKKYDFNVDVSRNMFKKSSCPTIKTIKHALNNKIENVKREIENNSREELFKNPNTRKAIKEYFEYASNNFFDNLIIDEMKMVKKIIEENKNKKKNKKTTEQVLVPTITITTIKADVKSVINKEISLASIVRVAMFYDGKTLQDVKEDECNHLEIDEFNKIVEDLKNETYKIYCKTFITEFHENETSKNNIIKDICDELITSFMRDNYTVDIDTKNKCIAIENPINKVFLELTPYIGELLFNNEELIEQYLLNNKEALNELACALYTLAFAKLKEICKVNGSITPRTLQESKLIKEISINFIKNLKQVDFLVVDKAIDELSKLIEYKEKIISEIQSMSGIENIVDFKFNIIKEQKINKCLNQLNLLKKIKSIDENENIEDIVQELNKDALLDLKFKKDISSVELDFEDNLDLSGVNIAVKRRFEIKSNEGLIESNLNKTIIDINMEKYKLPDIDLYTISKATVKCIDTLKRRYRSVLSGESDFIQKFILKEARLIKAILDEKNPPSVCINLNYESLNELSNIEVFNSRFNIETPINLISKKLEKLIDIEVENVLEELNDIRDLLAYESVKSTLSLLENSNGLSRTMVVKVLKGSKDKVLLEYGLEKKREYGILSKYTLARIDKFCSYLINTKYISIRARRNYYGTYDELIISTAGKKLISDSVEEVFIAKKIHTKELICELTPKILLTKEISYCINVFNSIKEDLNQSNSMFLIDILDYQIKDLQIKDAFFKILEVIPDKYKALIEFKSINGNKMAKEFIKNTKKEL